MIAVTTEQMKRIDSRAIRDLGIPSLWLMENAATAVADAVAKQTANKPGQTVLAVCGTGNNGGDGLACARILASRGIPAVILLVGNPEKLTPDAAENLRRARDTGLKIARYIGGPLPDCGCIVDAVFGFGLNRQVGGVYGEAIAAMNDCPAPVIACDIPSGLCGNTGVPLGIALRATETVTFTCPKQGLLFPTAAEYTGTLTVADIGIPQAAVDEIVKEN